MAPRAKDHQATRRLGLRRLADAARLASRPVLREHGFALPAILTDWAVIVGPALARDSAPERLSRSGSLTIRVAGPCALELQHRTPEILERIASYFGHRAVTRLRIVQGPLPKSTKPARKALPALSAADNAELLSKTARLAETPLRRAIEQLGRAVLAEDTRRNRQRLEPRNGPSL